MEKKYGSENTNTVRNLFGDISEDIVLFLLHASGINIISEQENVTLDIAGIKLNGTLDVTIDLGDGPKVYDIKSSSEYSFKNKFSNGFIEVLKEDFFGYGGQIFGYAHAKNLPVGGWIVINKSTAEILVVEAPKNQEELKLAALKTIEYNILNIDTTFKRVFSDIEETFRKKKTGNRILCNACSLCGFKYRCWSGLQTKSAISSISKNPRIIDYTYIEKDL